MAKESQINEITTHLPQGLSGCFFIGKLDGVDFVQSGELENGKKYNSSIKLKFNIEMNVTKEVQGIKISTIDVQSHCFKIPVSDSELVTEIQKYNLKLHQRFIIEFSLKSDKNNTLNAINCHELS
ncbi:MAG: hypothetical protein RBS13_02690 [Bacteroidales bacterium]|jgi:hypothetical protein|nr:hypothetical protein [Bacteroidales bacterium]